MKNLGTVELGTERLVLRRFGLRDAGAVYRNWVSDAEVTRFLRWPAHEDVSVTEAVLRDWVEAYARPDFYQWAIVPKAVGEPIGTISAFDVDERIECAHIGYAIGRPFWRQGYTSEALREVIRFLFEDVGLNRIESQHDPNNPGSGAVMRRCGMVFEGVLRQADFSNQGVVDAAMYSLLRSEYVKE